MIKFWDEFEVGEVVEFLYNRGGWDFIVKKDVKQWIQLDTRFHASDKEPEDWESVEGVFSKDAFGVQPDMYEAVSHGKWQQDEPE
jgi:hypothetical protein